MNKAKIFFWLLVLAAIFFEVAGDNLFMDAKQNRSNRLLVVGLLLSAIGAYVYYKLLFYNKLAIVTGIWDISALILTTLSGLLIFKEKIDYKQITGVVLGIISLICLDF